MKIRDGTSSSIDCQLTTDHHKLNQRRNKTRAPVAGSRRRVKCESGSASADHILLSKFQEKSDDDPWKDMELRGFNGGAEMGVSARKLAAGLWHLAAEFASSGGGGGMKRQCGSIHPLPCWIPIPKSVTEGATKWDPGHFKRSRDVNHSNSVVKLYESQHTATTSIAPALQVELIRARICSEELEAERRWLRKKFKHFVRKLNEERNSWMRKECEKMHAVVDSLKDDLRRERRNCKQLDIVNSKLLVDLADSKLSSRKYMHDYERERKSREFLEDVCNELVKEIEVDRAEIEALKTERDRIGEEVEEERKMLQLAEVWREERVQMKLIDAKLLLEEKYCLMSNLISELQSFLSSNNVTLDMTDLIEVPPVVKQVVDSLNIQEMKEFSSSSPVSNGIYTPNEGSIIFEAKKLGTNECAGFMTPCHSSAVQIVGTESRNGAMNTSSECLNGFLDDNESCKDASGRETVTQAEDHISNYSVGETEHSVKGIDRGRYLLCGKVNHEQNTGQSGSLDFATSEISPVLPKKLKKKGSSFRKLWRSSQSNDDFCKTISLDDSGRFSNGSTSNADVILSENVTAERALAYQDFVNHCCSGGPRNPHATRATKGCIEWPRGIPKHGLKSKHLEARIESQKSQLHNVLKHLN